MNSVLTLESSFLVEVPHLSYRKDLAVKLDQEKCQPGQGGLWLPVGYGDSPRLGLNTNSAPVRFPGSV